MSRPIRGTGDPAEWMLYDDFTTTPVVHLDGCYICEDPEFAQMGLPLCRPCRKCREAGRGDGHIAADDSMCDVCGWDEIEDYERWAVEQDQLRRLMLTLDHREA